MPYQYKPETLSDDEVNRLTNACQSFDERFVVWTLLDAGLGVTINLLSTGNHQLH
jgi:integrase/recombinase XerD